MKSSLVSAWQLPSSLKRAQLQQIATLLGTPLAGTKPQLLASIHEAVLTSKHRFSPKYGPSKASSGPRNLRVLSIDMGIRNLAFAFLACQVEPDSASRITFGKPMLQQWQRIGLTSVKEGMSSSTGGNDGTSAMAKDLVHHPVSEVVESFAPDVMSEHAYAFAKYCSDLQPTHILIERQRFRSGGRSAVQEWSLRVGMLEAMLYATFRTLKEEKLLTDTLIEPVLPMRVNKYWFRDQDIAATGKHAKVAKIAIVADMLKSTSVGQSSFTVHSKLPNIVGGVGLGEFSGMKVKANTTTPERLSKLDDLSDALLQGLAWLHWQDNRIKLYDHGPAAIGVCD